MMETLALFIRFSLSIAPPLPPDALAVAWATGGQQYQRIIEALGKQVQNGTFLNEIPEDIDNHLCDLNQLLNRFQNESSAEPDLLSCRGHGWRRTGP
jgi:hypothetical protein